MKKTLLTLIFAGIFGITYAQLNMSLRSTVNYTDGLNDVWGWKNEADGIEYALVGLQNGVSIVSLADPDNAVEVQRIAGVSSTWRDIKTWGNFAYVSNETGNGIAVIDLSGLPDAAPAYNWQPDLPAYGGVLTSTHNIFVDEFGILYLAGSNLNNGGMLLVDVATDPATPEFIAAAPPVYAHDVYVRDNKMYASEIWNGTLSIYDVSDRTNVLLLASQPTPSNFTHNAWLNDAGDVVFTTDEVGNAPVAAYDISDWNNIVELDQYIPIATMGAGVIPHNVHVWNDWLVISYYTDGGIIVDASRPENLIEVGNFDTFLGGNGGFSGAWGLYPFLPSGLVLVSDIGNGLYVLDANYVRACWLEGIVTDAITNEPIQGAKVVIDSDQANLGLSGIDGKYETGQALNGAFEVTYSKAGYMPETLSIELENGVITMQDVALTPLVSYTFSGVTVQTTDGVAVPNASVIMLGETYEYQTISDANGSFSLPVFEDNYQIYAGAWGYQQLDLGMMTITGSANLTIELLPGYYEDDFILDLGWTTSSSASSGHWERAEPIGTTFQGSLANPDLDIQNDLGDLCYMTGNGGGQAGNDDVDNGVVRLVSPVMDLTAFTDPILTYYLWFINTGGGGNSGPPNDNIQVIVSNGTAEVAVETVSFSNANWRDQSVITLADAIEITDNMQVIFETSDMQGTGHLVEAAVDVFEVTGGPVNTTKLVDTNHFNIKSFPNPFSEKVRIDFELSTDGQLHIYNALGQHIQQINLDATQNFVELGEQYGKGVYFIEIAADGQVSKSIKIVKQ